MLKIRHSRRSKSDITQVYHQSFFLFGRSQAESYVSGLLHRIEQLRHNPEIGLRMEPGNMRCLVYRSHKVFYNHDADSVKIVRILDARRDTTGQL